MASVPEDLAESVNSAESASSSTQRTGGNRPGSREVVECRDNLNGRKGWEVFQGRVPARWPRVQSGHPSGATRFARWDLACNLWCVCQHSRRRTGRVLRRPSYWAAVEWSSRPAVQGWGQVHSHQAPPPGDLRKSDTRHSVHPSSMSHADQTQYLVLNPQLTI